jgi:hypothetical protein
MALNKLYDYTVPAEIKDMKNKERQIIELLNNIKAATAVIKPSFFRVNLKQVLDAVKEGRLVLQSQTGVNPVNLERSIGKEISQNYKIDLSEAKKIIDDYINHSEHGCEYCGNLGKTYKDNKKGMYCKIDETEDSVVGLPISDKSVNINTFYKKGCENRTTTLKPLEKLLKEQG